MHPFAYFRFWCTKIAPCVVSLSRDWKAILRLRQQCTPWVLLFDYGQKGGRGQSIAISEHNWQEKLYVVNEGWVYPSVELESNSDGEQADRVRIIQIFDGNCWRRYRPIATSSPASGGRKAPHEELLFLESTGASLARESPQGLRQQIARMGSFPTLLGYRWSACSACPVGEVNDTFRGPIENNATSKLSTS